MRERFGKLRGYLREFPSRPDFRTELACYGLVAAFGGLGLISAGLAVYGFHDYNTRGFDNNSISPLALKHPKCKDFFTSPDQRPRGSMTDIEIFLAEGRKGAVRVHVNSVSDIKNAEDYLRPAGLMFNGVSFRIVVSGPGDDGSEVIDENCIHQFYMDRSHVG